MPCVCKLTDVKNLVRTKKKKKKENVVDNDIIYASVPQYIITKN